MKNKRQIDSVFFPPSFNSNYYVTYLRESKKRNVKKGKTNRCSLSPSNLRFSELLAVEMARHAFRELKARCHVTIEKFFEL